ncbi:MAG: NfeD family protein [Leptolyngbyaceae cyanobacterium MO_188.B28]|nr:NfeD family protein [Leptolyngbyaceae cyanobacterium MO_188.B28]
MKEYFSDFLAFTAPKIEMFEEGLSGVVTKPIALYQPGRIKCQGTFWRAKLYEPNCQATLLQGQPVIAVGRENLTFLVAPLHCPINRQKANDLNIWPSQLNSNAIWLSIIGKLSKNFNDMPHPTCYAKHPPYQAGFN